MTTRGTGALWALALLAGCGEKVPEPSNDMHGLAPDEAEIARRTAQTAAEEAACRQRYAQAPAAEQSGYVDPDVEAGFLGHDQDELRLAARFNARATTAKESYNSVLRDVAVELASNAGRPVAAQPSPTPSASPEPIYRLPLPHLTQAERRSLCLTAARMIIASGA